MISNVYSNIQYKVFRNNINYLPIPAIRFFNLSGMGTAVGDGTP